MDILSVPQRDGQAKNTNRQIEGKEKVYLVINIREQKKKRKKKKKKKKTWI